MEVPSGRILNTLDMRIVPLLARYEFIRWRDTPIRFRAVESRVEVGGRQDVTDHPDLAQLLGLKISRLVRKHAEGDPKQQCLIGIPTAGTALAQVGSMVNFYSQRNFLDGEEQFRIIYRIMRESLKSHGTNRYWVDGEPDPLRHTYWIVDNTITDGGSKFDTRVHLQESGYPVYDMRHLILVDRQQGGIKRMEQAGFSNIVVAYNLLDLIYAFGEKGLWPKERVQAVEEEIRTHQLV